MDALIGLLFILIILGLVYLLIEIDDDDDNDNGFMLQWYKDTV